MDLVQMDIHTIAVGGGVVPSLVVLQPHVQNGEVPVQLPIKIGTYEAMAISSGIDSTASGRPMTHDLLKSLIESLGATLQSISIIDVHGTTFYAQLDLVGPAGRKLCLDCRPSDAIALAVRADVPILASQAVLDSATLPDFRGVEQSEKRQEMERFHDFVESLSPADFE